MGLLQRLFGKKKTNEQHKNEVAAKQYTMTDFWSWFSDNQNRFLESVKTQANIHQEFINPVMHKLNRIQEGAFILTGMMDEKNAELIITAEGNPRYFPFVNDLIAAAPNLSNWKFTALKPAMNFPDFGINMGGKSFTANNIFFYPENDPHFPDEISLHLVYSDEYDEDENDLIENAVMIFLENYLGEIKSTMQIDRLSVSHKHDPQIELNPITKLNDYINWREKEFIEKYEGTAYNTEQGNYSAIEWTEKGQGIVGMVNSDLIRWDKKASHPWIVLITIAYDSSINNGMPIQDEVKSYFQFENDLYSLLPDEEGYLHVAHSTGRGKREIYYANKEFERPIQVLTSMKSQVSFNYDIEVFKDKYWRSMAHFEH